MLEDRFPSCIADATAQLREAAARDAARTPEQRLLDEVRRRAVPLTEVCRITGLTPAQASPTINAMRSRGLVEIRRWQNGPVAGKFLLPGRAA